MLFRSFMKRAIASFIIILLSLAAISNAKEAQPVKTFTIGDLINTRRVSDPQISPDGRTIAYTITDTDKAANKRTTQIYLISVDGGEARSDGSAISASPILWSRAERLTARLLSR